MMDFWSENQGQSNVYSRFGTVPGRNCAHSYQDRHQAAHCALNLGEQQAHGESRGWTVPGSRTALHQYTNWTDPSSSSSHFPVILDTEHHHDQGEYQQHEASDREWTSHRAVRDYERGFLREGWQRRWEPSNPLCYSREVSAKRNDSNYRELEAWAARYSHSLPRRRRLEAELRGSSKGLVERDCRYGTDPQIHPQHVQLDPNSRMSELWERGCRMQAPSYYPSQAPATDRNYMKENISYQRRIFSQPPGYVAPPPYKNPPKSFPVQHHHDTSLEQLGRTQAYWSQLAPRKQNVSIDLEQEEFRKSHENKTCPELEGLKHKNHEEDALQDANLMKTQKSQIQSESIMALEHPKIKQETSSKVIEGRKFRLNKKTGGMTIFCLVSRIADASETPSLPVSTSQTIQSPERGEVSNDVKDRHEINQLADEVDFRAPTCTGEEVLEDDLQNVEGDTVSLKNLTTNSVRQVGPLVPPVSVKYPLWREPSSMSSAGNPSKYPMDEEQMDNEDRKGLLVIDTSCVVVKVELIPSPKKERVHYSDSSMNTEQTLVSSELNHQLTQDMPSDQIKGDLKRSQGPETDLDLALLEKENKRESDDSVSSMQPFPLPEAETLEERAERILGIHLPNGVIEQQPEDEEPIFESPDEEAALSLSEQTPEDAAKQGESLNHQEVVQTDEAECFKDSEDFRSQVTDEYADLSKDDTDLHFKTVTKTSTEDPQLESTSKPTDDDSAKPSDLSNSSFPSCEHSFLLTLSNTQEEFDPELVTSSSLGPHPDMSPLSLLQLPSPPSESTDSSFNSTSLTDCLPSPPNLEVRFPPVEASGAEHEDRKDESGVNSESLDSDMKEEVMSQQQDEFHQSDAAANKPEKHLEFNALPQQLGCVQNEGDGEKSPQENNEDPTDNKIQIPETDEEREDNTSEGPKDGNLLEDEDALCIKESVVIPEESQTSSGLIAGSSQDTDTQIQIETEILQPQAQASDSECEESLLDKLPLSDFPCPPQAPPESEKDFNSLLEIDPVSSSPLSFDVPVADIVGTSSFYLDSCEKSSQFSRSLSSSPPVLPPISTPHEDSPHVSPPATHKEKAQYPKTLRDVVTRIRKHTAPDSESEEEVSELWDPEIVYENLSLPEMVVDVRPEINLDEAEELEVLKESAEIGYLEQDDKELHVDEDTLSCSSTSSHLSEDTIIIADEKIRFCFELEGKNEEFDSAVGEICCSGEVQDETSSGESEEEEVEEEKQSGESEKHLVEVENITTRAAETREMESNEVKG